MQHSPGPINHLAIEGATLKLRFMRIAMDICTFSACAGLPTCTVLKSLCYDVFLH